MVLTKGFDSPSGCKSHGETINTAIKNMGKYVKTEFSSMIDETLVLAGEPVKTKSEIVNKLVDVTDRLIEAGATRGQLMFALLKFQQGLNLITEVEAKVKFNEYTANCRNSFKAWENARQQDRLSNLDKAIEKLSDIKSKITIKDVERAYIKARDFNNACGD